MTLDLEGKMLIAMPTLADSRFSHSVILMLSQDADGAMGLIVNKPMPKIPLDRLLENLPGDLDQVRDVVKVHFGGPVETGRGFVVHSDDYTSRLQSQQAAPGVAMTATMDILEDIAAGNGPRKAHLMLGYAGWGAGQLEAEVTQNSWLTCAASADLVFHAEPDAIWHAALHSIGVDPRGLSGVAGRA